MKRFFSCLGPAGWVVLLALGLPLAASALGEEASDRVVAEQILATMTSASSDALTHSPVAEANRALERAQGARQSGDVRHAEQLEGLAREWAETARDLVRAASVEGDAGALEVAAADAGVQAERARALLEEAIARRGRAEAELEKLSADAGPFPIRPAGSPSARTKPAKAPAPLGSARAKGTR